MNLTRNWWGSAWAGMALLAGVHQAAAQGTAFTYQGQLSENGAPANGWFDLHFTLFDAPTGGTGGATLSATGLGVTNGLFLAILDFGANPFDGTARWLEISARTNGSGSFTTLSPRQELTPAPYSLAAESLTTTLPLAKLPAGVLTNNETGVSFGNLALTGDLRLNSNHLLLTPGSDATEGLVFSNSLPFSPSATGPFLFGYEGGALGTVGPFEVNLAWDYSGNVWISNNLNATSLTVDRGAGNGGSVRTNALTFGSVTSGEGIASERLSGGNQYDLEFYTSYQNRLTILNNGKVGINTTNPSETFEINGTGRMDDHDLYMRANSDRNHGIGYRGSVMGISFDGPFIYGYTGGGLGTENPEYLTLKWDYLGDVWVSNNLSVATLTIRHGADFAEPFPVTGQDAAPGTVMVIDEANPGHLKPSEEAYDTRVAGIISGAGGIRPGIQLQQDGLLDQGQKVALTGRVYVKADATQGAIKPGDLLTTSPTPGHAMRVSDHGRAQGAVLGKAMTPLREGQGLVLVLVTLQ